MKCIAVIMAGGSGERFWPLSRVKRPKQLLKLTSPTQTLLEEAVTRIQPLVGDGHVFIVTGRHLEEPIREANVVHPRHLFAEPMKRNTLGALCWTAASLLAHTDEDMAIAVLTADHKISDPEAFRATVGQAFDAAIESGALITCGVVPTRPETGYGYIEVDPSEQLESGAIRSAGFREKPDLQTAQFFLESGRFLWNSGMFFYTLKGFMSMLRVAHPEAHDLTLRMAEALKADNLAAAETAFAELPNLSIDYALAEKTDRLYVVEARFGWDDVGAWDALSRSLDQHSEEDNVALGEVVSIDCRHTILYNDDPSVTLTAIGLEDVIAVVTQDAVMLCRKSQAQRVKEIVERLKAEGSSKL